MPLLRCARCGNEFDFVRQQGGGGRFPIFCGDDCRLTMAVEQRRRSAKGRNSDSVELLCKTCGTPFSARRKQRGRHLGFCSAACRKVAAAKVAEASAAERRSE